MQFVGLCLMIAGLFASSFATKVGHLIVTQGIIFGTAGGLVYFPTILYLDEWFIQRKGFAFGVLWWGTIFIHTIGFARALSRIFSSPARQHNWSSKYYFYI